MTDTTMSDTKYQKMPDTKLSETKKVRNQMSGQLNHRNKNVRKLF